MELIAITENGELAKSVSPAPEVVAEMMGATMQLYRAVGYEPPWIGYLAVEDDICVGFCGFKSPPHNNRVEIAYFTFPEYESRGIATRMAAELISLALDKMPAVTVAAQTLPEENASLNALITSGLSAMLEILYDKLPFCISVSLRKPSKASQASEPLYLSVYILGKLKFV